MHKIWENRPEDLRVDAPGENTRYALSLRRGGGWGENCYQGCQDLNFTRTSKIIKLQAALKTDGQVLHVGMLCIPLGDAENFRNCIGANLGFCASFL